MHLIVDGFGCDPERLSSAPAVRAFLDETPEALGMRAISPVCIHPYQSAQSEMCGVSGFVIIAESHLSIHTWPERGVLWADIFSCKPFDSKLVVGALVEAFGIGHCKVQIVERDLVEAAYLQVERVDGRPVDGYGCDIERLGERPLAPPPSSPQLAERGVI